MLPPTSIETKLDAEINSLLDKLKETTKDSEDYGTLVDRIAKLHKLKAEEHVQLIEDNQSALPYGLKPPSFDAVLFTAANIFGILWLARYEKENVIKSPRAFSSVMRLR
jgi:hypothetical protein